MWRKESNDGYDIQKEQVVFMNHELRKDLTFLMIYLVSVMIIPIIKATLKTRLKNGAN